MKRMKRGDDVYRFISTFDDIDVRKVFSIPNFLRKNIMMK
jgi:hypothetical protein